MTVTGITVETTKVGFHCFENANAKESSDDCRDHLYYNPQLFSNAALNIIHSTGCICRVVIGLLIDVVKRLHISFKCGFDVGEPYVKPNLCCRNGEGKHVNVT